MTSKDWKKDKVLTGDYIFYHKTKNRRLYVEENYGEWSVYGTKGMKKRRFKTKPQALKYAKAYMRKH